MTQAIESQQQQVSNLATNPRSKQEQFEQALKIATEVVKRAEKGNKTCMGILREAGALR